MRTYVGGLLLGLVLAMLAGGGLLLAESLLSDDEEAQTAAATATSTPSPTPTASATPTATPTPTPTPTPYVVDAAAELAAAKPELEAALAGLPGEWGLAVFDLPSGAELGLNENQPFYPASAGKIVIAIAVLRQVQEGIREFQPLQDAFEQMMVVSSDERADDLDALVNENETLAVLRDAGASDISSFPGWRRGFVTARDLALVWKGLVEGNLLDAERTAYLVELTSRFEMEEIFETFPARFGRGGYLYGQKAGYNIQSFPYTFVGAGYTVSMDLRYGFVAAFILHTEQTVVNSREQRTRVYPIITAHLLPPE